MAKIDVINIKGSKERCVNLSYPVGMGGRNLKSDVMMLQALFFYLLIDKEANVAGLPFANPLFNLNKKSFVTGFFDMLTIQAIAYFQMTHRRHLLNVDAVVHPAHYEGRVISDIHKPLMMITYLHLLAKKRALATGDKDYIESIKKLIGTLYAFEIIASAMPK